MPLAYAIMPIGKNDKIISLSTRKPPEVAPSGGFRISVDTIYKSRYNLLTLYRKEFVMHTSQETIWQSTDLRNDMNNCTPHSRAFSHELGVQIICFC